MIGADGKVMTPDAAARLARELLEGVKSAEDAECLYSHGLQLGRLAVDLAEDNLHLTDIATASQEASTRDIEARRRLYAVGRRLLDELGGGEPMGIASAVAAFAQEVGS